MLIQGKIRDDYKAPQNNSARFSDSGCLRYPRIVSTPLRGSGCARWRRDDEAILRNVSSAVQSGNSPHRIGSRALAAGNLTRQRICFRPVPECHRMGNRESGRVASAHRLMKAYGAIPLRSAQAIQEFAAVMFEKLFFSPV
jgi:hypothetical protein